MKTQKMPLETRRPPGPPAIFPPRRGYVSLSIKDLLDARDAYHVHLSLLDNVVATAIGRYLIHEKDWFAKHPPGAHPPKGYKKPTTPRTLANSVLQPWSWPAVLVFVRKWEHSDKLGRNAVPQTLYLPDGRVVPVCVLEAAPDELPARPAPAPFPTTPLIGGGYTCVRDHQGEESFGTFGCLVRKGGSYYALTNRHVAGGEGETVSAFLRSEYVPVATTSGHAVDRLPMNKVFESWPYAKSMLTMDAGLAKIEDIHDWTSQSFGIGEISEVFDATEYSITLDMVGTPVCAYNTRRGASVGEIRALFFRFESIGGYEHVTDLLIGPRQGAPHSETPFTQPGDSGSIWFYDPPADEHAQRVCHDLHQPPPPPMERGKRAPRMRPIAMQWGGQRTVLPGNQKSSYALATFLSSICRALDVEVVRDWSVGHDEYWGKIGHFTIGYKACAQPSGKLGTLMRANKDNVGFDDSVLGDTFTVDRSQFVPLADVPDYVWIGIRSSTEPVQHFADIDIQDIHGGPTLLDRCFNNPSEIAASLWKEYFDGFAAQDVGPEEGVLPFRVWQIYDAMVKYVNDRDVVRFVAAAGVLAHYVGDASQPLHCSYMHHGLPPMKTYQGREYPFPRTSQEFEDFKKTRPAKIHGIYEQGMLEVEPANALQMLDNELASNAPTMPDIASGHEAAIAIIRLMHSAQKRLDPMVIFNADDPSLSAKKRAERLWSNLTIRKATIECLADSIRTLAAIWAGAWKAGGGSAIPNSQLVACDQAELMDIYRKSSFLPSLSLNSMASGGRFEP